MMTFSTTIMFPTMIILTVTGNILMKKGANLSTHSIGIMGLFNWFTISGVICFGSAMALYFLLLRTLPLHFVQAISSIQFVLIVVASAVFLSEGISIGQWAGFALIATGIAVVGFNT